jgi:hypothetical protein
VTYCESGIEFVSFFLRGASLPLVEFMPLWTIYYKLTKAYACVLLLGGSNECLHFAINYVLLIK